MKALLFLFSFLITATYINSQELIIKQNGNVGIGVASPLHKLHVFGNGSFNDKISLLNTGTNTNTTLGYSAGNFRLLNFNEGSIEFWTSSDGFNANQRMVINKDGKIGIGTQFPGENLEVIDADPRVFIGTNSGNGRGLLLDGVSGNSARIESYDYLNGIGLPLALNSFGGGRVGIGTTSPEDVLHVHDGNIRLDNNRRIHFETVSGLPYGNIWMTLDDDLNIMNYAAKEINLGTSTSLNEAFTRMTIENNGEVGIGTTNPTALLTVNGTVNKPGGGSWAVYSDLRSKQDIKPYKSGLDKIILLNPVSFVYKPEFGWGSETYVGLVAQEVKKIAPEMVDEIEVNGIKDFKEVDPNELTYMLINAVKELKAENEDLKRRLAKLEGNNKHLN